MMRINRYQNDNLTENYLDLYYNMVDSEVAAVLNLFHADKKLIGRSDEAEEVINITDIYYFEIVDQNALLICDLVCLT